CRAAGRGPCPAPCGRRGARPAPVPPARTLVRPGALVLALRRVELPLALLARLLVVAMLAQVRKGPGLLALLLAALQRALEVLIVVDDDFRQTGLPPFVAFVRRLGICSGSPLTYTAKRAWATIASSPRAPKSGPVTPAAKSGAARRARAGAGGR